MSVVQAGRRLVIADNRMLGVLKANGGGHVFTAFEPRLAGLDGHRFRSPEVAKALLALLVAAPPGQPARRAPDAPADTARPQLA